MSTSVLSETSASSGLRLRLSLVIRGGIALQLRILILMNGDSGEREHARAVPTMDVSFYAGAFTFVKFLSFFRIDSPLSSTLCAPESKRSSNASATVGSPKYSCQCAMGS